MEKRFVKLGDKYFYVEATQQGLSLVPATMDQVVNEELEQAVLVDPTGVAGDNFLQKIIDESKDEMVGHLKRGLKETVLACLGFEKETWGNNRGFKVDHCNSRMSQVSEHIKVTLQEIFKNATVEDLGITEGERQGMMHAFHKDLKAEYLRKLRDNMWNLVNDMAHKDAEKVVQSMLKERQETVAKMVLDKLFNK